MCKYNKLLVIESAPLRYANKSYALLCHSMSVRKHEAIKAIQSAFLSFSRLKGFRCLLVDIVSALFDLVSALFGIVSVLLGLCVIIWG